MLVMLGAITLVPVFGGTASAHHSNISATVACTGTVSWTATSWATGPAGTNPDIRVFLANGASTTQIGQGKFEAANNYQFSGTVAWPSGASSVMVSSKPFGTWGNGTVSPTGSSVTLTKPTNCTSQPTAATVVSCTNFSAGNGDGVAVLTLTNPSTPFGSTITVNVYNPDQTVTFTSHSLANGQTKQVTFSALGDGLHTVKVLAGATDLSQSFTIDCDSPVPSATHTVACVNGDGQVTITLRNTGGEAATFDVTNPSTGVIEHVVVGPSSTAARTFSGFADGAYTVLVMSGTVDLSQAFVVDCDHALPKVSNTVACDASSHDGTVLIALANEGTEAVVFQLTNPATGAVEQVTVAPGSSATRTFTGFSDGSHTVKVTADGQDFTQAFQVHCDLPPSVSHSEACVAGDGVVSITLTNNGDDVTAEFVVQGTTYTLAPGATRTVTIGALADGGHTISMTANGVDSSFGVTVNCDRPGEPAADITSRCANEDGTVVVTLRNIGGQLPLVFTVEGVSHSVPANSSVDVALAGLNDGTQTIRIAQGTLDLSQPATIACDLPPAVNSSLTCVGGTNGHSDGQVVVTLQNNGDDLAVTFVVDGSSYVVGPKASTTARVDGLSDGAHTIAVATGGRDFSFDVDVACDRAGVASLTSTPECVDFNGAITETLAVTGGELPTTFTVNGVEHTVQPDTQVDVLVDGLANGTQRIEVSAGDQDLSFDVEVACDPALTITARCASVDVSGEITDYWFDITNTEGVALAVTWDGGEATIPAGETVTIAAASSLLVIMHDNVPVAGGQTNGVTCVRSVTFTKELKGQPTDAETYTVRVSRLTGATYTEELTFDLQAGVPQTINLPSTLDAAGVDFRIEEINAGTAVSSVVSPDQLKLAGHLGETVTVVITNGYASVQIDKTSFTVAAVPGAPITYSLQAVNTGGMTLHPVVILDRLPADVAFVSASVDGGAGQCVLTEAARPQLVTCTMSDPLAPSALTKQITLVVQVDTSVAPGSTIVNQAQIRGMYDPDSSVGGQSEALLLVPSAGDLSCDPVIAGAVCDLSAVVSVPVVQAVASSPPASAAAPFVGQLPTTGAKSLSVQLAIAIGSTSLGLMLMLSGRRTRRRPHSIG
jgi:uncharacterized repeat protein (TIGR01451 family)